MKRKFDKGTLIDSVDLPPPQKHSRRAIAKEIAAADVIHQWWASRKIKKAIDVFMYLYGKIPFSQLLDLAVCNLPIADFYYDSPIYPGATATLPVLGNAKSVEDFRKGWASHYPTEAEQGNIVYSTPRSLQEIAGRRVAKMIGHTPDRFVEYKRKIPY